MTLEKVAAAPRRANEYTEVHKCRGCSRAFWGKEHWNRVIVVCPYCQIEN